MRLLKREVSKQFMRFCLIGTISTVLYFLIFLIFYNYFKLNYLFVAVLSFIIASSLNFFLNKINFEYTKKRCTMPVLNFILISIFSTIIILLFLKFLVEFQNWTPFYAILAVAPITTAINFFGFKIIAFKNKKW